jgi:hypothetical protein
MRGITSNGFVVFKVRIAFLRTDPGMKIADPLNLTSLISPGAGMLRTSCAVVQSERSWTVGTIMLQSARAEFKSMSMLSAWEPILIMQTTLLLGRVLVPPKFLGECVILKLN